jgi:hypothetical protein
LSVLFLSEAEFAAMQNLSRKASEAPATDAETLQLARLSLGEILLALEDVSANSPNFERAVMGLQEGLAGLESELLSRGETLEPLEEI